MSTPQPDGLCRWVACAMLLVFTGCIAERQPATPSEWTPTTVSPSKKISIRFHLDDRQGRGVPCYSVTYGERVLIDDSPLGLVFSDGPLTGPFRVVRVTPSSGDERYEMVVPTRNRSIRDRYNQTRVELEEREGSHSRLTLIFRAYDDGVAFRYEIPADSQVKSQSFTLTDETSTFTFVGDPSAHVLPLKNYTTSYEAYYQTTPLSQVKPETLIGLPLLLEFPSGPWMAISEADLTDYAGMYLAFAKSELRPPSLPHDLRVTLVSKLSPLPGKGEAKVMGDRPRASPWRVMMIADRPERFLESNLIVNLNPPCAIKDTSWIHTGKLAFPWWNGYMVPNQPFRGGVNTPTMKYYIDFCAENGIEFHSVDGFDVAWYGGPCSPYEGADITRAIPQLNMPEVLAYARQKGVRTRIWLHWAGLKRQMDEALATYERWGADGIMVDFMDRDDQEMVNFYHEVLTKAAAHHLTVNFHGAYKPTGLQRTYPNLMNCEAVLNEEYNKWSRGSTPEHQLTVAFTRMIAGPLDYHSGGFRSVKPGEFVAQNIAPLVQGTRAHQLAMYVVYENPLPMLADDPAAYRDGRADLKFLREVPTTWDETRALAGEVGEYIVIARRHRTSWYIGAMNAMKPRELELRLDFLGPGEYEAEIYADSEGASASPTITRRLTKTFRAGDTIHMNLAEAGGQAIRLIAK